MKLNLGCGKDIKEGFVNIDKVKLEGVDVVLDIGKEKLPFKDNSVTEVLANHIFEHIWNLDFVLKELYRICKNNAKML